MTTADAGDRTAHLLALMKKGDDAFNSGDVEIAAFWDAAEQPGRLALRHEGQPGERHSA